MKLIDEIQTLHEESHKKWFERWYEKYGLEKEIIISAKQGYSGYKISVSEERDNYIRVRLCDPKTINLLREKLGNGFTIKMKTETGYNLLDMKISKSYINIRWED